MAELKALSAAEIGGILEPFGVPLPALLLSQLETYLELLLRWNSRTNLTAIRDPREIVRRHFGESLFAAACLESSGANPQTLLDYGSGAGFPGLPIHLANPSLRVTLAESQHKKATFLREVIRALELSTEVWGGRVDAMPLTRTFDVVTLRAVDRMQVAVQQARSRCTTGGLLLTLESDQPVEAEGTRVFAIPGDGRTFVVLRPGTPPA